MRSDHMWVGGSEGCKMVAPRAPGGIIRSYCGRSRRPRRRCESHLQWPRVGLPARQRDDVANFDLVGSISTSGAYRGRVVACCPVRRRPAGQLRTITYIRRRKSYPPAVFCHFAFLLTATEKTCHAVFCRYHRAVSFDKTEKKLSFADTLCAALSSKTENGQKSGKDSKNLSLSA